MKAFPFQVMLSTLCLCYVTLCVKTLPPLCLKKIGNYRFKIVQNQNWTCEACILKELPFYQISTAQITSMVPKFVLPHIDKLNDLFVNDQRDNEHDDVGDDGEFQLTHFSHNTKYKYSNDVVNLNFDDEPEVFESFPIISLNIRSIVNRNNFSRFQAFLQSLSVKPMIIALNETWINDLSQGPYSKLKGYKFIQNNRHINAGGGVAFYVADHLHPTKLHSLYIMKEKSFESLFISVDINGKEDVIFGTLYRSPGLNHTEFSENLDVVLKDSTKKNKQVIIMGDLNYDLLNVSNNNVKTVWISFLNLVYTL